MVDEKQNVHRASKELLQVLNDAQAFVGKSKCSVGHPIHQVRDNAEARRCVYCEHQWELYQRLGKAFQSIAHEPCEHCETWKAVLVATEKDRKRLELRCDELEESTAQPPFAAGDRVTFKDVKGRDVHATVKFGPSYHVEPDGYGFVINFTAEQLTPALTKLACCGCYDCSTPEQRLTTMIVCIDCGNKRCPKATNHANACTNSNEPQQRGSRYGGLDSEDE